LDVYKAIRGHISAAHMKREIHSLDSYAKDSKERKILMCRILDKIEDMRRVGPANYDANKKERVACLVSRWDLSKS
jgi:hypothetical protein